MFRTSGSPAAPVRPTVSAALWAAFRAFLTEGPGRPARVLPRRREPLRRPSAARKSAS